MKALKRLLGVTSLLVLALLACLRVEKDYVKEIRSGKLAYATTAGWVNRNHANPAGAQLLVDDLRRRWRASGGLPFDVTFAQQMSGRYLGIINVISRAERTYHLPQPMTEQDLERVAWGIFRQVAEVFETMQGAFPNAIDANSQGSSFREGDLMGNRIAFYRALRGYSEQQVRDWTGLTTVDESVRQFSAHPITKCYEWTVPPLLAGGPLDELPYDAGWFAAHATKVREKQSWFRLSLAGR